MLCEYGLEARNRVPALYFSIAMLLEEIFGFELDKIEYSRS